MVIVDFDYVTKGKQFKEMVQDFQQELLTGGILTNIFRPKRKRMPDGSLSQFENQIVMYVDGKNQADETAKFFRLKDEVREVEVVYG